MGFEAQRRALGGILDAVGTQAEPAFEYSMRSRGVLWASAVGFAEVAATHPGSFEHLRLSVLLWEAPRRPAWRPRGRLEVLSSARSRPSAKIRP